MYASTLNAGKWGWEKIFEKNAHHPLTMPAMTGMIKVWEGKTSPTRTPN